MKLLSTLVHSKVRETKSRYPPVENRSNYYLQTNIMGAFILKIYNVSMPEVLYDWFNNEVDYLSYYLNYF